MKYPAEPEKLAKPGFSTVPPTILTIISHYKMLIHVRPEAHKLMFAGIKNLGKKINGISDITGWEPFYKRIPPTCKS